jgi:hypothetical protein
MTAERKQYIYRGRSDTFPLVAVAVISVIPDFIEMLRRAVAAACDEARRRDIGRSTARFRRLSTAVVILGDIIAVAPPCDGGGATIHGYLAIQSVTIEQRGRRDVTPGRVHSILHPRTYQMDTVWVLFDTNAVFVQVSEALHSLALEEHVAF